MQLEFDFEPQPEFKKLFFLTSGLNTNELCYTVYTDYGNAEGYSYKDAKQKLIKSGYTVKDAQNILSRARHTKNWIVYQYQQNFKF